MKIADKLDTSADHKVTSLTPQVGRQQRAPQDMEQAIESIPNRNGSSNSWTQAKVGSTSETESEMDSSEDENEYDYQSREYHQYNNDDKLELDPNETTQSEQASEGIKVRHGYGDRRAGSARLKDRERDRLGGRDMSATKSASFTNGPQSNPSVIVNDSWLINYHGIIVILPIIFNSFQDKILEKSYQRYSNGQRKKSLIIAHAIDLILKLCLFGLPLIDYGHRFSGTNLNGVPRGADSGVDDRASASGDMLILNRQRNDNFIRNIIEIDDISNHNLTDIGDKLKLADVILFGPLRSIAMLMDKSAKIENGSQIKVAHNFSWLENSGGSMSELGQIIRNQIEHLSDSRLSSMVLELIRFYRISAALTAINLITILSCLLIPQRKLRDKLNYIALMTWFLFCLQSSLIYNSTEMDMRFSISSLDTGSNNWLTTNESQAVNNVSISKQTTKLNAH